MARKAKRIGAASQAGIPKDSCDRQSNAKDQEPSPPATATSDADRAATAAWFATEPTANSALMVHAYGSGPRGKLGDGADFTALWREIGDNTAAMTAGNQQRVEAMLYGQAVALEAIFTNLARRAAEPQWLPQFETYMRLALKAQSQCRTTLQTLFEMKNPRPVAFVQQANIANGPQQVNNAPSTRGGIPRTSANELLAADNDESQLLDGGAPKASERSDPAMVPLARVNGTEKPEG